VPDDPGKQILAVLAMAQEGRFGDIRDLFAKELQPLVTAEALRVAWEAESTRVGPVRSIGSPVSEPGPQGSTTVRVLVTCERGSFALIGSIAGPGTLTGLQTAPPAAADAVAPWGPPDYAETSSFVEQDVEVGAGSLAVPGTLAVPSLHRPCPAVVILAGSGPNDRDGTIGRNKPLKDLAWGLASRGIAVLRFDKVTFVHPGEVTADPAFTVVDEYVTDATSALGILRADPAVDPGRIFLAGHSLGGTIAPRVAEFEPGIAGLVLFAAGNEPIQWAAVRQVEYLASLDPATAAAQEPVIRMLTEQAKRVDSPELSPDTPSGGLPFGVPAPYWLDLRGYDPVGSARLFGKPILVLQGGRDYQVTVDGDLAVWRTGLATTPDVTFRVYPDDNHFFFAGSGPSMPAELDALQHLDLDVIRDVSRWITSGAFDDSDRRSVE
jgi:dienelactone hydrolase